MQKQLHDHGIDRNNVSKNVNVLVIHIFPDKNIFKKFSGGIQTRKDLCTSVPLASCSGEIKKIVLIGLQCSWVLSSLHTSTPSCFGQIQIMQSFQLSSSPAAQKVQWSNLHLALQGGEFCTER